ncbi:MAG: MoaD/ThiS family protein [Planctomycetaceae bacterium]|nr:MoaD/ThiS family protein [Planctomycetaceae bacterium]
MSILIQIPRILGKYTNGQEQFSVEARSLRAALNEIKHRHPALYSCICDETDTVRTHVNLFVNNEIVVDRKTLALALKPNDVVSVFQAVSGG